MAFLMFTFGSLGVALEVVFTALSDFRKTGNRRLLGFSYIWMFPIYATIPLFLRALEPVVAGWAPPLKIALYVVIILIMEWLTGWAIRLAVGEAPWEREYRGKRWAVQSLVRLDYAPLWAVACAYFQWMYNRLAPLQ